MSYSALQSYEAPAQSSSMGAVAGAAVGAVVGAVVLAAVVAVSPTNLHVATTTRPAMAVATPVSLARAAPARFAAETPMYAQTAGQQSQELIVPTTSDVNVYSCAFVAFAAIVGAVNGLFLWNQRRVALAATTGRREALMAGASAVGLAAGPAFAAYGDAANVFGKQKDVEQYFDASGEGWTVSIPGKYNVSREREVDGMVARWEDNFDAVNNSFVVVRNIGKNGIAELGDLDSVRNSVVTALLGQQAFDGQSISEGGFAPGRYSSAAILDQQEITKGGKTYYFYELLTRTADGNEGGRHQLFSVTASNGKLYIYKAQAGDKRWFKGLEKPLRRSIESFTVA